MQYLKPCHKFVMNLKTYSTMQLINPLQLTEEQQEDLKSRCEKSAAMRKGVAATGTIDFKLEKVTVYGRLIRSCTAFAIERVEEKEEENND